MTPGQILACLQSRPDAHITTFHKALNSAGGGAFLSGSAMIGCTLNYREEFYSGWAPLMEKVSINIRFVNIFRMEHMLEKEQWGTPSVGGTIFRLKDKYQGEYSRHFRTQDEVNARIADCERMIEQSRNKAEAA